MRPLVITGTDTGVGKTVVTAALAALAAGQGQRVAVVKPVQTGAAPGEPGDLDEVRRLSGIEDVHEYARFPEPLAPGGAARRVAVTRPLGAYHREPDPRALGSEYQRVLLTRIVDHQESRRCPGKRDRL
jgi:dethiobiotin synthetase